MRLARTPRTVLLAVAAVAAVVLAACAPSEEPAAEPPAPEPADAADAEDAAVEDSDAEEIAATEADAAEPDGEPAGVEATEEAGAAAQDLEVTAYVVAYHWGFALFDEDGNELDLLRAPVGASVELVAVNDHASEAIAQLPGPVAEAIGADRLARARPPRRRDGPHPRPRGSGGRESRRGAVGRA